MKRSTRKALSRIGLIGIVIIIVVAVAAGVLYYSMPPQPPTTTTTTTPTGTHTTTTTTITTTTTHTTTTTTTTPPSQGIVLRVLTRHPSDILTEAKKKFLATSLAKKYNIVDIIWLPIEPPQWIDTINYAGQRPGQEIDIAWGGGPTMFDLLLKEGLLATINSSEVMDVIQDIPEEIAGSPMVRYDDNGNIKWIAAAIASFGFTINRQKLDQYGFSTPEKWVDLASPDFAVTLPTPMVGVADPTKSTSNTRMYEIILQIYGWNGGWKIITRMGANARIYDQSGLVRDAVIRGDIAVGITIDFYGYTAQLKNPNQCLYILPKDGTIVNGDPIALLTTSKHKEAAQAFIAWVLSPEGQALWMNPNINRMPVNPKVFDETPEGRNRTDLKAAYDATLESTTIEFSDEMASSIEEAMRWFFFATITQAHDELQSLWKDLALAYLSGKITQDQFNKLVDDLANPSKLEYTDPATGQKTTFTLQTAQNMNTKILEDVNYRNQLVSEWTQAAKQRYQAIHQELQSLIG